MTQNRDRKNKIRARMAATGEPYSEAARQVDSAAGQARLKPPPGWRSVLPEMTSTSASRRDSSGRGARRRAVAALATVAVPWRDPAELVAEYEAAEMPGACPAAWAYRDSGQGPPRSTRPGRQPARMEVGLTAWMNGLTDVAVSCPPGSAGVTWSRPLRFSPVHGTIGTITSGRPGGTRRRRRNRYPGWPGRPPGAEPALDQLGYTVDLWRPARPCPLRVALPGHLAERDWYTVARVRIVKETTVGAVDPRVPARSASARSSP